MSVGGDVRIVRELPDECRRRMAELYYEAFADKVRPLLGSGPRAIGGLARILRPDATIGALVDGWAVGVAGLTCDGRRFFEPRAEALAAEYGRLRGRLTAAVLRATASAHRPGAGELHVEALAVDSALRGRGIGTRLLEAVHEFGREKGFAAVTLEVVDTNTGAIRLYERLGYMPVKRVRFPLVGRFLGFSAVITMLRYLT